MVKYAVVETSWGEVLLAGKSRGLCGLLLPATSKVDPHRRAKRRWPGATLASSLLQDLQTLIGQYFEGEVVDFSHVQADLSDVTDFQRRVLTACKRIEFGQTVSYGDLAKAVGQPKASRAAGAALAANPIPLVIPCHRVVGCTGEMVGFSAEQGTRLKKRMLELEARATAAVA